jgi:hypothetical protein
MEVGGSIHDPAALSPRIEPLYPGNERLAKLRNCLDVTAKRKVLPVWNESSSLQRTLYQQMSAPTVTLSVKQDRDPMLGKTTVGLQVRES